MRSYNRSLDLMLAAAVKLAEGKVELSAKLMAKAVRDPSFARAVQIVEASNKQAYEQTAKLLEAKKKVKAAEIEEDKDLEDIVGDMDEVDAEVCAETEEPEEAEEEGLKEEMHEENAKTQAARFASVLSKMVKK